MPSSTSKGLPYPLPTEPLADGADAIKNLAQAVDARISQTLIASTVLAAPAATIDTATLLAASGGLIPQTFNHLRGIILGRASLAATGQDVVGIRFNNDATAAHYRWGDGPGGTAATTAAYYYTSDAATSGQIGALGAAGARDLAAPGVWDFLIPGYALTVFEKMVVSKGCLDRTATEKLTSEQYASEWLSTAAINRITLLLTGGSNFLTGTAFWLYGIV